MALSIADLIGFFNGRSNVSGQPVAAKTGDGSGDTSGGSVAATPDDGNAPEETAAMTAVVDIDAAGSVVATLAVNGDSNAPPEKIAATAKGKAVEDTPVSSDADNESMSSTEAVVVDYQCFPQATDLSQLFPNDYFRAHEEFVPREESSNSAASREKPNSEFTYHPSIAARECVCCLVDIAFFNLARVPCGHEYCRECLVMLFQNPWRTPPPRCCNINITLKPIGMFADFDQAVNTLRKSWTTETLNRRTYCANRPCSTFIHAQNITGTDAKCTRCSSHTCTLCKGEAHSGDCPKDSQLEKLLQISMANSRQCYSCSRILVRVGGSGTMKCRCKAEFCHACGQKWETCRCPHWPTRKTLFEQPNIPFHVVCSMIVAAAAMTRGDPERKRRFGEALWNRLRHDPEMMAGLEHDLAAAGVVYDYDSTAPGPAQKKRRKGKGRRWTKISSRKRPQTKRNTSQQMARAEGEGGRTPDRNALIAEARRQISAERRLAKDEGRNPDGNAIIAEAKRSSLMNVGHAAPAAPLTRFATTTAATRPAQEEPTQERRRRGLFTQTSGNFKRFREWFDNAVSGVGAHGGSIPLKNAFNVDNDCVGSANERNFGRL